MNKHECTSASGDNWLNQGIVDLKRIQTRLYEYRCKTILSNGKDGGYICVSRYNDFISFMQQSHFLVSTEYQCQRVKTVGYADTMPRAYILRVVLLKVFSGLAFQIPTAIDHTTDSLMDLIGMHGRDALQGEIGNRHCLGKIL